MTEQHHSERRSAPRKNPVKSAAERLVEAERKALIGLLKAQQRERRV
jgi:DNA helicase HerA-like ATPase